MTDYVQGLDVSHYSGPIDWADVFADRASPKFAYMKATQGVGMTDKLYSTYRQDAKKAGLLCGAYHFFMPGKPVEDQVDHFVATVGSVEGELPPMLDVEMAGMLSQSDYADAITDWLRLVGERLQCTPGIYTTASFWDSNIDKNAAFPSSPLWIAHYTSAPMPTLPWGVKNYSFWQYSQSGMVGGINEPVDLSRYPGTLEDLQKLCL